MIECRQVGKRLSAIRVLLQQLHDLLITGGSRSGGHQPMEAGTLLMFRPPRQHLAFAFGPHMCLGLHLARMETRVVVGRLLDRLPDLRIDPDAETPYITGMTFRAPNALPVVF